MQQMKCGELKQSGFSLVELAIVLAIIGLIVGGIMAGQDLMRNSQFQKMQGDIMAFDGAIQQFREKYNGYPGDLPDATTYWSTTANGNGDYMVNTDAESVDLWQQLGLASMIPGTYTGTTSIPLVGGSNIPKAPFDGVGYNVRYYPAASMPSLAGQVNVGNVMEIGFIHSTYAYTNGPFLNGAEAQAFDAKIDDGYAAQGRLRGSGATSCPAYNATSGDYSVSAMTTGCNFNFVLDRF